MPTLIYAAAGQLETLKAELKKPYTRILAFVPHPQLQEELQHLAKEHKHLQLRTQALAPESGQASLHLMNLPAASSLEKPTGIKRLYPNLSQQKEVPVDTLSIEQVVTEARLDQEKDNTLILETNGQEEAILQALVNSQQLQHFKNIQVRVGQEPLFEKAATADGLNKFLNKRAYQQQSQKQRDPEHPLLNFKLNYQLLSDQKVKKIKTENEALKEELSKAKQERDLAQKERDQLQQQQEKLQKEFELACQEKDSQLSKKEKKSKQQQEQLAELQIRSQRLENENYQLNKTQEQLTQEFYKAQGQLELLQQLIKIP
ncbi:methyltransferase, FkbM family [Marinospirillum celere]|uniref:Methyltransferase, FkbM family n=1 Tax=Marinospirillum celere TaxID=1122252 RepID=A0A1I1EF21_9GAMM|nr:hypothetical protein [Marinospirillum celere]SFB83570.1 methyltransferase, FkbM family [Marinospirillum celere]